MSRPLVSLSAITLVTGYFFAPGCGSDDGSKATPANDAGSADSSIGASGGVGASGSVGGSGGIAGAGGSAGLAGAGGSAGLAGSGGIGGTPTDAGSDTGTGGATDAGMDAGPTSFALYPNNGEGWGSWVTATGIGALNATDAACDETSGASCDATVVGAGTRPCAHAGELRQLPLPFGSCSGVTVSDALGAFDWVCDDSTGAVRAVSTGLQSGKHLSDLIDWTGTAPTWTANSITASDGSTNHTSTGDVWWSNPVVEQNVGASLATPGTVYAVSQTALGLYVIAEDSISLVTGPGVVLEGTGAAATVVNSNSRVFIWVEAEIDATGDRYGMNANSAHFSVFDNIRVHGATDRGFDFDGHGSSVRGVTATDNGGTGLEISGACSTIDDVRVERNRTGLFVRNTALTEHLTFRDIVALNNTDPGMWIGGGSFLDVQRVWSAANKDGMHIAAGDRLFLRTIHASSNTRQNINFSANRSVFADFASTNSPESGLRVVGTDNVFVHGTAVNNGSIFGSGLSMQRNGNVVLATTTANSRTYGFEVGATSRTLLMNIATANNARWGLYNGTGGQDITWINCASTESGDLDVQVSGGSDNVFSGLLRLTDNTECFGGGTNPGISAGCTVQGASDATIVFGSIAGSFAGKVNTDDATNPDDALGVATFDNISDFLNFDNRYRGWGIDGDPFPALNNVGQCNGTASCRIWDYRLSSIDVTIRGVVATPTAADTHTHVWDAGDQAVCEAVPGRSWNSPLTRCETIILRAAMEQLGDGIGNENGLCESNETCIVLPNLGAYQGSGALISAGSISVGGAVENVTLLAYSVNGE